MPRWITLVALLLASSCYTYNGADLLKYKQDDDLLISEGPAPEDTEPLQILSVYKSGFYILGLLPIVNINLDHTFQKMREQAHAIDADGISHVCFEHSPASPFKFTVFPLPDWSAWIHCQGMAWRWKPGKGPKPRAHPGPIDPSLAEPPSGASR